MTLTCAKSTLIGAVLGLADGLSFVVAVHTATDFFVPFLFWVAIPCLYVALRFNLSGTPEWLP